MKTSGKTLVTTPSLVLAVAALCTVFGYPQAAETHSATRQASINEKQSVELKAEREALEKAEKERLQQLALNRIKENCTIAHYIDTGKAAHDIHTGAPFFNLEGKPVPQGRTVCAANGSTAQVIYNQEGVPVLANEARVHMDDLAEYESYYKIYRKNSNE